MSKKKASRRGKRYLSDVTGPKYQVRKKLRTFNWSLLWMLIATTGALLCIQHVCFTILRFYDIQNIYLVFGMVFFFLFLFFNRGFNRSSTPLEKLPAEWNQRQKEDYLEREDKNRKIARIFMAIMVPFLLVLTFDFVLYLLKWGTA